MKMGMAKFVCKAASTTIAVMLLAVTSFSQTGVEDLRITGGKSIVIDYPTDIGRVSTANPEVVDAIPVTSRELLVNAKGVGSTTLVVWGKNGQRTFYNVTVDPNLEPLRKLLRDTFPKEEIQIQAGRESLSLVGKASSQQVADRVLAMAAPFGKNVVNNLAVTAAPVERQIILKVKFAELNRQAQQQLGANIISTGALGTVGGISTGQYGSGGVTTLRAGAPYTLSDALNVFAFRPDLNLGAFVKALQSENILQILAEPNLVTTNDKEAQFLVGGEVPVPILQGAGSLGAVTVQFKEFGIRLNFTPTITPNNTIKMKVKPEVSTIDVTNGVTVGGFTIPGFSTRRIETSVELAEGQSFVIGGLIDDRAQEQLQRIPGISNIPILGQLFKSREIIKRKTELIVIVTPEFASPLNPGDVAPLPVMPLEILHPFSAEEIAKKKSAWSKKADKATGSAEKKIKK
jgi:pilus assembly protein CpaC